MLDPPAHMARQGKAAQVYLTKDERRRLRRQARRERHQEQMDKIAAGLIPPPPPKLRLSNMMRVLGDKAVADPSKLEAYVREQVAQRQRAHEARNAATKLTPQEKWGKIQAKRAEDEASGPPQVVVFFVADLHTPPELAAANRFKLDANAQKLGVTGCVVATKPQGNDGTARRCNLVVAEGGAKAVLRFEKQVGRIPFPGGAHKVWAGQVARKAFVKRLEFHDVSSAPEARSVLERHGVPHYWDAALARAEQAQA
jgi:U4/U6 small nuclear ribonucleoprotein PRP3